MRRSARKTDRCRSATHTGTDSCRESTDEGIAWGGSRFCRSQLDCRWMRVRSAMQPLVGVIMGSQSDWETMQHASEMLKELGVAHEVKVVSAHRTPDLLFEYASSAAGRG